MTSHYHRLPFVRAYLFAVLFGFWWLAALQFPARKLIRERSNVWTVYCEAASFIWAKIKKEWP